MTIMLISRAEHFSETTNGLLCKHNAPMRLKLLGLAQPMARRVKLQKLTGTEPQQ